MPTCIINPRIIRSIYLPIFSNKPHPNKKYRQHIHEIRTTLLNILSGKLLNPINATLQKTGKNIRIIPNHSEGITPFSQFFTPERRGRDDK